MCHRNLVDLQRSNHPCDYLWAIYFSYFFFYVLELWNTSTIENKDIFHCFPTNWQQHCVMGFSLCLLSWLSLTAKCFMTLQQKFSQKDCYSACLGLKLSHLPICHSVFMHPHLQFSAAVVHLTSVEMWYVFIYPVAKGQIFITGQSCWASLFSYDSMSLFLLFVHVSVMPLPIIAHCLQRFISRSSLSVSESSNSAATNSG